MSRSNDWQLFAISLVKNESAVGRVLNMEGKVDFFIFKRNFQAGEFGPEGNRDAGLDLLLQLPARRSFNSWHAGIATMSDESPFRLGLDPISEMRDEALKFHV